MGVYTHSCQSNNSTLQQVNSTQDALLKTCSRNSMCARPARNGTAPHLTLTNHEAHHACSAREGAPLRNKPRGHSFNKLCHPKARPTNRPCLAFLPHTVPAAKGALALKLLRYCCDGRSHFLLTLISYHYSASLSYICTYFSISFSLVAYIVVQPGRQSHGNVPLRDPPPAAPASISLWGTWVQS